jgi:hypothetical protein
MLILNALVGFITGAVAAFTMVWAAPDWVYGKNYYVRILEGCIGGGILGGLIGSITGGDPNRSTTASNHGFLVAAIFGVIGGYVGADRGAGLFALLESFHIPTPFH